MKKYAEERLRAAREEGHLPCPDSYSLRMTSDFSGRLRAGCFSAWVPGQGFLRGPHLVTRIPCAHPGDIVLVHAVDDLRGFPCLGWPGLTEWKLQDQRPHGIDI